MANLRKTKSSKPEALLFFSFGGPEKKEDVMPFLEHVTAGKNIPKHRLEHVAKHYYHFDGKSPINDQNRKLIAKVKEQFSNQGLDIPMYFGNLHAAPFIPDTVKQMVEDGVEHAAVFCTSAFSSFSGCRKYRNELDTQTLEHPKIELKKIRLYFNHPQFIESVRQSVIEAKNQLLLEDENVQTRVIFTAHSIPEVMAASCQYEKQLTEACKLVMNYLRMDLKRSQVGLRLGDAHSDRRRCTNSVLRGENEDVRPRSIQPVSGLDWKLAYQSRSGPPSQPWLEPDIAQAIKQAHIDGVKALIVVPIGFVSDHMEVMWDLDVEAMEVCNKLGVQMVRAKTASNFPSFIDMVEDLWMELFSPTIEPKALGQLGAWPAPCPEGCCEYKRA